MFFALVLPWHDTYDKCSSGCHANRVGVITTRGEKHEICWNEPKTAVTLLSLRQAAPQQSKASFDCIRLALSLHRQSEQTTPVKPDSTPIFDLLIQNKYNFFALFWPWHNQRVIDLQQLCLKKILSAMVNKKTEITSSCMKKRANVIVRP